MTEIESVYNKKLSELRAKCGVNRPAENRCPAARCICSSMAECMAYHSSALPHGYVDVEISSFNGHVNGNRTVDNHVVATAIAKVMNYCFGDSLVKPDASRYDLYKASVMDQRFSSGTNLIIHGESKSANKNKLGKTMLASIVMKEAIWRRMFKDNKAYTYMFKSCAEIVDDIISKRSADAQVNSFNADWLCIDDLFLSSRQSQGHILDQIMSVRLRENLPSILVIQFDPFKINNPEESLGNHVMKMLSDKSNTFVVSLG